MRTAEEIIKERHPHYNEDKSYLDVDLNGAEVTELINEARIEAIKECHEIAKEAELLLRRAYNKNHDDMGWDVDYQEYINNRAIKNLIDQAK